MMTIDIKVTGEPSALRELAARIAQRMHVPFWQSFANGEGILDLSIDRGDCHDAELSIDRLEAFARACTQGNIDFLAPDLTADVHIKVEVDSDGPDPLLPLWPNTLVALSQLGLGLTFVASVGDGYTVEGDNDGDVEDDAEVDRTQDIDNIVEILTTTSRSAVGRSASHTFALVKLVVPTLPLAQAHRAEISSRLARSYAPPFYVSKGAAKSAASQHARAIWAMSNGFGDSDANSIFAYLESLRSKTTR